MRVRVRVRVRVKWSGAAASSRALKRLSEVVPG